jgi:type VI secretion system protein ImpK
VNLDNLHGQRGRAHVAQIYFLCLALGFQGKYPSASPGGTAAVVEGLGNYVALTEGGGETARTERRAQGRRRKAVRRELPYVFVAIGFLILALIVIFILWLVIGSNADSTADEIKRLLGGGK